MLDEMTLLDEFTQKHGTVASMQHARAFMLDYLRLFQQPVPDVVIDAMVVAERYARAELTDQALVDARSACWAFLRQRFASIDFTDPTHNVVRAALCLLSAEMRPSELLGDFVPWFLQLADSFEDHAPDLEGLLKKHFAA